MARYMWFAGLRRVGFVALLAALLPLSARAQAAADPAALAKEYGPFGLLGLLVLVLVVIISRRRKSESIQQLTARVKIYLGESNRRPADAVRALEEWSGGDVGKLSPELHRLFLQGLYECGREEEVEAALAAYPIEKVDIHERYWFGRVLEQMGRLEQAEGEYRRIMKSDSDYADVKMRIDRVTGKSASDMELAANLDPSSIPQHLKTKYRSMELIGKGGMGFVFKAYDIKRKRHVALKALSPFLIDEEQALERFLREAKLLAKFEHPNVVKIFDVEEKPIPYYTMEFVTGRTLGHRIEEEGGLPIGDVLSIATGTLSGLAHVHKHGVVHRDIKPENIMLDTDGTPRLTDFGLAVGAQATRITQTGQVMGTLRYMPPEQLRGQETGPSGDLFALGVTLYESLTGFHAFEGEDRLTRKLIGRLSDVAKREIPPGLEAMIELMMESVPENRIQTAVECLEMVRSLRRELGRKGPATFLQETLLLRDRGIRQIGSFFAGLSGYGDAERQEFLAETGNLRDLKLLVWNLNEHIDRIQAAGSPPPGADPRGWARDTGSLRNDLAKFVRSLELAAVDAFALRARRLDKELDAFLDPYRLNVLGQVLEPIAVAWDGKVLVCLPDREVEVFGCPDVEDARAELREGIEALMKGAGDGLERLEVGLELKADDDRWLLTLRGPGIERDYVKGNLLFEAMGAEVGFEEEGVFKAWLPIVVEDRTSRANVGQAPDSAPSAPAGTPPTGGEVVEPPAGI